MIGLADVECLLPSMRSLLAFLYPKADVLANQLEAKLDQGDATKTVLEVSVRISSH
jgi:hypothetical protein